MSSTSHSYSYSYWMVFVLVVLMSGQFSEGFVTRIIVPTSTSTSTATISSEFKSSRTTSSTTATASSTKDMFSHEDFNFIPATSSRSTDYRRPSTRAVTATGCSTAATAAATAAMLARFPPRGGASVQSTGHPKDHLNRGTQSTFTSTSPSSVTSTSLFATTSGDASGEASGCPFTKFATTFGAFWGSFGVIYILAKAITRVLPIALEPFAFSNQNDLALILSPLQWCYYALSCLVFAYAEGYKGFHKKFAPLVVKRSFTLVIGTRQGNNPLNYLLAPFYSMGLWGATSKRLIVSWGVTTGVALLVAIVKRLPQAPRSILDAGVVVGLTVGSASILYHFARSILTGQLPNVDACLPSEKTKTR